MANKRTNWIKRFSAEFHKAEQKNPMTVGGFQVGNCVAVMNVRTGKIGTAFCSPSDDFDLETGIAIAWARMHNVKVPEWVLNDGAREIRISALKTGDIFKTLDGDNHQYEMKGKDNDGDYVTYDRYTGKYQLFYADDDETVILLDD